MSDNLHKALNYLMLAHKEVAGAKQAAQKSPLAKAIYSAGVELNKAIQQTGTGAKKAARELKYVPDNQSFRMTASDSLSSNAIYLEELPVKGKRSLRKLTFTLDQWPLHQRMVKYFFVRNVWEPVIKRNPSSYDEAKRFLIEETVKLRDEEAESFAQVPYKSEFYNAYEDMISSLKVTPEGKGPLEAKGRDFSFTVNWDKFTVSDPDGDYQNHDPHYTEYASASAASARKLYKLIEKDPGLLSNVAHRDLTNWFRDKGINYKVNFSTWS